MRPITQTTLALLLLPALQLHLDAAQESGSALVRLIRVEGSFGTEVPAKIISTGEPIKAVVALQEARIDSEPRSFLTRLRLRLTLCAGSLS